MTIPSRIDQRSPGQPTSTREANPAARSAGRDAADRPASADAASLTRTFRDLLDRRETVVPPPPTRPLVPRIDATDAGGGAVAALLAQFARGERSNAAIRSDASVVVGTDAPATTTLPPNDLALTLAKASSADARIADDQAVVAERPGASTTPDGSMRSNEPLNLQHAFVGPRFEATAQQGPIAATSHVPRVPPQTFAQVVESLAVAKNERGQDEVRLCLNDRTLDGLELTMTMSDARSLQMRLGEGQTLTDAAMAELARRLASRGLDVSFA